MTERWINYFSSIAKTVAQQSTCPRRKVGAVLVRNKRIIATGFNGMPSGFEHCQSCFGGNRKSGHSLHSLPCLHAEDNAIAQCAQFGPPCQNAIMFVTVMPCNDCLKKIINAGIKSVYCLENYPLDPEGERLRDFLLVEANRINGFTVNFV